MSLATQLARLSGQTVRVLGEAYPATVKIGPQTYDCAISGKRDGLDLGEFGGVAKTGVSFLLPLAALAAAGQPQPRAQSALVCTAPASHEGSYTIESVSPDATGAALLLRCTAPHQ